MARSHEARLDLRRPLVAGLWLATIEALLVVVLAWSAFLSAYDRLRYIAIAFTLLPALVLLGRLLAEVPRQIFSRVDDPARAIGRFAGVTGTIGGCVLGWALTQGRRVHDASWRELGVILFGLTVAWGLSLLSRYCYRRPPAGWRVPLLMMVAAGGSLAIDQLVLVRQYPAFHVALGALALVMAVAAGTQMPLIRLENQPATRWASVLLSLATVFLATLAVVGLHHVPGVRHAIETRAPLSGKALATIATWMPAEELEDDVALEEPGAVDAPGIDLRDGSILLITIDALRADRLAAYGAEGGATPSINALSDDHAVIFEHAYTPTPHTSYALASLLTGKFMREVMALQDQAPKSEGPAAEAAEGSGDVAEDEAVDPDNPPRPAGLDAVSLPELLREYGYRTAAFYPPAIFFVDAARFATIAETGFGFEYRKRMFANASDRVQQLQSYLTTAEGDHPLFVWVHLFEPHEPYDPPAEFRRGETTIERYDGEVAAADAAVGQLVDAFRAARPGATVILTADHGEELGDHGGWYHGSTLYEEQARVPLIWSSPGVTRNLRVDRPVELVDIPTTILSALGIPRDPRMRGDDLAPLLAGADIDVPRYAFASVGDERMVTDGRHKLTCDPRGRCRLVDLDDDPEEHDDHARDDPETARRLRGALARFVGSIPRVEAMAMEGDVGWPEALARAQLGDETAASDVVPLLGDARPTVRAAAARALARLGHEPALVTLLRLVETEQDPAVWREAALTALLLGATEVVSRVADEAEARPAGDAWARRAAVVLTAHDRVVPGPLRSLVLDEQALEQNRRAAIDALGRAKDTASRDLLIEVLEDVRLRAAAAEALGAIGGRSAADALALSLSNERYLPAREAEARALVALGDRRAPSLIRRFLGVDRPLPGGVGMLQDAGDLSRASGAGALLTDARIRSGFWECDASGCRPGAEATIQLPSRGAPAAPAVAIFRVCATEHDLSAQSSLRIDGVPHDLPLGCSAIAIDAGPGPERRFSVVGRAGVEAVAVVPKTDEVPPPAPEPWEPGEPEETDGQDSAGDQPSGEEDSDSVLSSPGATPPRMPTASPPARQRPSTPSMAGNPAATSAGTPMAERPSRAAAPPTPTTGP